MTTYAFVDTETTGLGAGAEVWEFAAIIRREDESESVVHIHVEHDLKYAATLDEKFRADHDIRFGAGDMHPYTRNGAASIIHAALHGTHLVGVNPAFDAKMLERLLTVWGLAPSWHYHLIDLSAMTIGYLLARKQEAGSPGLPVEVPWRSDDLAAQVMPMAGQYGEPKYARHTALGDAEWSRDWWDALTVGRGAR
ncbi:DnaQ-like DNA polymerase III subunit [Gordonia phage Maridalia]|uniref:DnaQ-like DNA polymerase III subunit n=2 Tax=Nymphadoravirus TaxID=2169636 RepID=A0A7G8LLI4_9CAUD|nr:DnaQ-like DNA polymerase III subunit [Gordonia phage Bunnybear]YP_010653168.1 DnaQ-like DNA polymerase III subunit [Gordonia phage Maridalia]AZF98797.1 DnaQ-like DNA polymerase III subunit [Gordonia phage Maridalia]QNJ58106.1 DnaQ-like DNA polymerase III subunit [Gordonia phage Bunnybear]